MGNDERLDKWLIRRDTLSAPCAKCHLRTRCVISAIPDTQLDTVQAHIRVLKPLHRGDTIYRSGEPRQNLLIIHAGSVKSSLMLRKGHEFICEYHLSGNTLGLDSLHTDRYATTSVAMETTQLCELSQESFASLSISHPELHNRVAMQASRALARSQQHQLNMAVKSADMRLASFLIDLSARLYERGYSSQNFRLPMRRHDLSCYLGIRPETLSRLLTAFRQQGLIYLSGYEIRLLKFGELCQMAEA